jgi:glycosyltransferase involved in cell wall biosynthesis
MTLAVVIPVRDRSALLERCLVALQEAVGQSTRHGHPAIRVVVADHGSRDGTAAVVARFAPLVTMVHSTATTVAGVRNDGASAVPDADALVFLDADCLVPESFLVACREVLEHSRAAAIGCEVVAPADGHWTERTWDAVHRPGGDGPRHYINSACFCVRREWFHRIAGFDADRTSSEDVDICQRLLAAGATLYQSERLAVLHLGNPQSIGGVYRRVRWHNEGVISPGKGIQWSPMLLATLGHSVVTLLGSVVAVWQAAALGLAGALAAIAASWLVVPTLFVAARRIQFHRPMPWIAGIALMSIVFPARWHGMLRGLRRRVAARGLSASGA